jgi:DNA polymerase-3 subunit gamma/tau
MPYQVLARKWRPQNFSSLVGQEPIVTALRNALAEGRIAQAYLFSGIRGVGKTTAARVLAKALNCERGPAADPCNECGPCLEITRGSDLDVIEVDAATYSKVEQVRELTESLRYGPARDRYKVVVLDEVHRLSRQAFDALLKIVEEPPPHLVFIFATTEIEAVPATILSRCQEFQFRRVPGQQVAALLREICGAEGIAASDTALRLVARAGEGSVRDAVALLDQLATFGSGAVRDEDAVRILGGLDIALFRGVLAAILQGDAAAVSQAVRRVEDEGWDARHLYGQFLAFGRDALHLALGGDPARIDLPAEETAALVEIARGAGYENLLRMLNLLLASEPLVRRSESGALALEIAWLRAAELPKLIRVEELLSGGIPARPAQHAPSRQTAPTAEAPPAAGTAPAGATAPAAAHAPAPPTTPVAPAAGNSSGSLKTPWAGAAVPSPAAATAQAPTTSPATSTTPATAATTLAAATVSGAAHASEPPTAPAAGGSSSGLVTMPEPGSSSGAAPMPEPGNSAVGVAPPGAKTPPVREVSPAPAARSARPSPPAPTVPSSPLSAGALPVPSPPAAPTSSSPQRPNRPPDHQGERFGDPAIRAFLDEICRRKQPLAAHLEEARDLRFAGGRLMILLTSGDVYLSTRLRQPSNRQLIDEAVTATWGAGASWDFAESDEPASPAAGGSSHWPGGATATSGGGLAAAPSVAGLASVADHPTVQTVLDIFGGRVEEVEEREGFKEDPT